MHFLFKPLDEIQAQNWELGSELVVLVSKIRNKTKALSDILYTAGRYQNRQFYDHYYRPGKIQIELIYIFFLVVLSC